MNHRAAWHPLLLGFAAWTVVGLAAGAQLYFAGAGMGWSLPWTRATTLGLKDWYLWAILSLPIWQLVDRCPLERHGLWKRVGIYLVACVAVAVAYEAASYYLSQIAPGAFALDSGKHAAEAHEPAGQVRKTIGAMLFFKAPFDAAIFWLLVSVRYAWNFSRRLQERYRVEAELKAGLTEARLQALRMQLQPHFLFNTLNAIAALIRHRGQTAELMVGALSDMLRTTLDFADRQEVALQEEVEFVRSYLAIEQMRFADRLSIRWEVQPDVQAVRVPAMILQPIVENAVRHGVEPSLTPSVLTIRAESHGAELKLSVQDTGPGFVEPVQEGIGLRNTRARLRQLYGEQGQLRYESVASGGAQVTLRLPLQSSPAPLSKQPAAPRRRAGGLKELNP